MSISSFFSIPLSSECDMQKVQCFKNWVYLHQNAMILVCLPSALSVEISLHDFFVPHQGTKQHLKIIC